MAYPYYGNPYYPQPMQDNLAQLRQPMMQPQPQMQPQNSVQWVSSEQEARNYLVAPNSAVALWDSSAPRVYLKQADASGKPMFKGYDLIERVDAPVSVPAASQPQVGNYVTRDEFDKLAAAVRELKEVKTDE